MEITDLGHVDLDEQIPEDAKPILAVWQEQSKPEKFHIVTTSQLSAEEWGTYFAHWARSISSAYKPNHEAAFAVICRAFKKKIRQISLN